MKRQKRSNNKKQNKAKQPLAPRKLPSRRTFLHYARNITIATIVGGGGVWFIADDVMATLAEQDLSKLGNGIPAIVQIHDPQCSQCIALQRQTRIALSNFSKDRLQYLVANIKSEEGSALAAKHGVRHVTLLLFDGHGNRKQIITGQNQSGYLKDVFQQHLDNFSQK